MKVKVFGPNLNSKGQQIATMHAHAAYCRECRTGVKRFGYNPNEHTVEVETVKDIVEMIYPPDNFQYDIDDPIDREPYVSDIHIFPCLETLLPSGFPLAEEPDGEEGPGSGADDAEEEGTLGLDEILKPLREEADRERQNAIRALKEHQSRVSTVLGILENGNQHGLKAVQPTIAGTHVDTDHLNRGAASLARLWVLLSNIAVIEQL
jgi:hypothetical protein